LGGTYMPNTGATSCYSCNGKCSAITRLFECTTCTQAQAINCTNGQYVPVYSCSRS
jgi:hypothetical protein